MSLVENNTKVSISLKDLLKMELHVMNLALDVVDNLIWKLERCKTIRFKDVTAVINLRKLVNSFSFTLVKPK